MTREGGDAATLTLADCAGLQLLGALDPAVLSHVLARCHIATYAAGEAILRRGQANAQLYFVLSGDVAVQFDETDRTHEIGIAVGRMFGEMSVIDGQPVSAFVVAHSEARILVLPDEVFWSAVIATPEAPRQVMRALSGLVRGNTARLVAAAQQRARMDAMERELSLARDVQMGMLRQRLPLFPDRDDFSVVARMEAAKTIGGDFYDAFLLDPAHLLIAIGDVSGKGIGAALFMARALTILRTAASSAESVTSIAAVVNEDLAAQNPAGMFLTLFIGVCDVRTGRLDYVNFGHPPPVLIDAAGAARFEPVRPGLICGMFEGERDAAGTMAIAPGEALLLYTDGVTEAADEAGALFGDDRLLAAAGGMTDGTPEVLIGKLMEDVGAYSSGVEQSDDITLLAFRFTGTVSGR